MRIQRLVEEIAQLSKKELRSEEYFAEFLSRVVQACDAKGGAVFLVSQRGTEGKAGFDLAAQVEFESSLFQSDENQRAVILKMLADTVVGKKPHVLPPAHQAPQHEPGSLEAQLAQINPQPQPQSPNRTPYPFLHVPLYLKEQVLGVLQVWMQPYVVPGHYQEFATFLSSLAAHVEQHLQGRRLGNLVLEVNRLQHVLKFANDLAGTLDPLEAARLGANYGRDLIGCERCSVLTLRGDQWIVLSISGQEVVEKKSSMVKAMAAFVGAHAQPTTVLLSKKELLARAETLPAGNGEAPQAEEGEQAIVLRRTDEIDLAYFELSHVVSAAVAPMLNADKELVGALFAESTAEGFFDPAAGSKELAQSQRLTEFLSSHLGRTIVAAQDYQSLPFLAATRRMRDAHLAVTGPRRRRVLLRIGVVSGIILAILLYPKMDTVEGNCGLQPMDRGAVVPEVPGRVEKVFVREGSQVKKGDPIAQLDKFRIETELSKLAQDKLRLENEAKRLSGQGDEASAQVALAEARAADEQEKLLRADLEATTLRAPLDGRVLTKDIELHAGEFIQPGTPFAEVAGLDRWEVQTEVNEKQIGNVEKRFPVGGGDGQPINMSFILYSQSAHTFRTQILHHEQISATAFPREKENVFIVTVPNVEVPAALQGSLRPGLTGRAKIELGRRPLILIWGSKILNWMRLKLVG
jgi:multidrug efflux pump subunit AcrA (membrane-fusion protein)